MNKKKHTYQSYHINRLIVSTCYKSRLKILKILFLDGCMPRVIDNDDKNKQCIL